MLHPSTNERIMPMTLKEAEEHIPYPPNVLKMKVGFPEIEGPTVVGKLGERPTNNISLHSSHIAKGNLTPCIACDRAFVYTGPIGDDKLSGRFCSDNCRQAYDNGVPTYLELLAINKKITPNMKGMPVEERKKEWLKSKVIAGPPNVEKGIKYYQSIVDGIRKGKRMKMTPQLKEISDALEVSRKNIKYNDSLDKWIIKGANGYIHADDTFMYLSMSGLTDKYWKVLAKRLSFMQLTEEIDNRGIDKAGEWQLDRLPNSEEAEILRKILGWKKKPAITEERKEALKQYLKVGRARKHAGKIEGAENTSLNHGLGVL